MQVLSADRSAFEWYLTCCSNVVWSGSDLKDTKYQVFAAHVPPFESHDAAACVIDAMPPRVVGALLFEQLGWLDKFGALRREPDVLPFDPNGVATKSAGAQLFWATVSASVCGVPPPDARLPWGLQAGTGWTLTRVAPGVPARVPPPCGSLFLWWPIAATWTLTPKNVRHERVVAADAAGARHAPCTLASVALPAVLNPWAAATASMDGMTAELSESVPGLGTHAHSHGYGYGYSHGYYSPTHASSAAMSSGTESWMEP